MDVWRNKGQESKEDYLEAILVLSQQGFVRSVDLAHYMGYSKASISIAVANLKKEEMVDVAPSGALLLTEKGRAAAERVYERHKVLTTFFLKLGVGEENARRDACRIEHIISQESFDHLRRRVIG